MLVKNPEEIYQFLRDFLDEINQVLLRTEMLAIYFTHSTVYDTIYTDIDRRHDANGNCNKKQ